MHFADTANVVSSATSAKPTLSRSAVWTSNLMPYSRSPGRTHSSPSTSSPSAMSLPTPNEDEYIIIPNPHPSPMPSNDKTLSALSATIESLSPDLRHISLSIHDHPELQFKEFHAHEVLTSYLSEQAGWTVTPSAYGIETAFVAVYDTGREGAVVSFNAEYGMQISITFRFLLQCRRWDGCADEDADALVGIGHACGHNLIAIVSLGAALACARVAEEEGVGGKVVLFGTPAEGECRVC